MVDVSIVMASRNSDKSIKETIYSVLNQTYSNFEFIIIDDGSAMPLELNISDIKDERIKLYRIPPSGLGSALNFGILKSTGKYIARIDDDDIMINNRIQKQFEFLQKNEDVVCLGTQIYFKNDNKYRVFRNFPINHDDILMDLVNCKFSLAHCTVMFRKETFDQIGGYRVKGGGQDLDLFLQLARFGQLSNINEYLTYYNLSFSGLSVRAPIKKYEAYLYALDSIKKDVLYSEYKADIKKSIKKVNSKAKSKIISFDKIKRILLIYYIRFTGENLDEFN